MIAALSMWILAVEAGRLPFRVSLKLLANRDGCEYTVDMSGDQAWSSDKQLCAWYEFRASKHAAPVILPAQCSPDPTGLAQLQEPRPGNYIFKAVVVRAGAISVDETSRLSEIAAAYLSFDQQSPDGFERTCAPYIMEVRETYRNQGSALFTMTDCMECNLKQLLRFMCNDAACGNMQAG